MRSKFIPLIVVALTLAVLLPGCHTRAHLTATPTLDRDLRLTPGELSERFYDIDRYRVVTFPFFTFYLMPPVRELEEGRGFGTDLNSSLSWWNLCPFFFFPPLCPVEHRTWERGNYRFEVTVARPFLFAYLPHIWYWEVTEIWSDYPIIEVMADAEK